MEYNWIVYITINKINGKFYIGVHRTNVKIFDGYIGNGIKRKGDVKTETPFHRAVKKYGYENFKRTILKIFPDTEEGRKNAFLFEKELVNETSISSKECYNVKVGGEGGANTNQEKRVYKFDLKGNFLTSFRSVRIAAESIKSNNIDSVKSAIKNCCLFKTFSAFGYYWSYKKRFIKKNNKNAIPVAQYTISGKFIKSFNSINEAELELSLTSIYQAVTKGWLCGGYQWKKYNNLNNDIEPYNSIFTKNKNIKIDMFDKKENFIKTYNSINECATENNLSESQINRVLRKIIHTHKGFIFKYSKVEDIV